MTTLMSSTNAALPKISYVKSIDVYLGTCFVMVFASLLGKQIPYFSRIFRRIIPQNYSFCSLSMQSMPPWVTWPNESKCERIGTRPCRKWQIKRKRKCRRNSVQSKPYVNFPKNTFTFLKRQVGLFLNISLANSFLHFWVGRR